MGSSWLVRAKEWARGVKRDGVALWLAARDRRVPWYAKLVAAAVAAYALSPIDLIPDFVPVLGYLDDLLIVPLGILIAVKLIPPPVMRELRLRAMARGRPRSTAGLVAILLIWAGAVAASVYLAWPFVAGWFEGRDPPRVADASVANSQQSPLRGAALNPISRPGRVSLSE